jgi:heterodisulfide reductase subunit C
MMRVALKGPEKAVKDFRLDTACGFEKCMQCGRCTASCPAAFKYEDYRPREVMRKLQLGDREAITSLLWRCGQCYSCAARCPRNNSVGAGILALREAAMASGEAPAAIKAAAAVLRKNLYERGETFLPATFTFLDEFGPRTIRRCRDNRDKRVRLGFDRDDARMRPIPEGAMREIRALMDMTWAGGDADA